MGVPGEQSRQLRSDAARCTCDHGRRLGSHRDSGTSGYVSTRTLRCERLQNLGGPRQTRQEGTRVYLGGARLCGVAVQFGEHPGQSGTRPLRTPSATASVRERTPSFSSTAARWYLTVCVVMPRSAAISLLPSPRATSRSTSSSRAVSAPPCATAP